MTGAWIAKRKKSPDFRRAHCQVPSAIKWLGRSSGHGNVGDQSHASRFFLSLNSAQL